MKYCLFLFLSALVIGIEYLFCFMTDKLYQDTILNIMARTIGIVLSIIGIGIWIDLFFLV